MKLKIEDPRWAKASNLYKSGNRSGALSLFEAMADDGIAAACVQLGRMYERGWGVKKDSRKAYEWYLKGYDSLHDSISTAALGRLFLNGIGVEQDHEKALAFLTEAIQYRTAEAYGNLGILYDFGKGVTQDKKKAKQLYLRAIAKGDKNSLTHLGALLIKSGRPLHGYVMILSAMVGIFEPVRRYARNKRRARLASRPTEKQSTAP